MMLSSTFRVVPCRDHCSLVFHRCVWFTQTVRMCVHVWVGVRVLVCVENAGERESGKILVLEKVKDTRRRLLCLISLHEVKGI